MLLEILVAVDADGTAHDEGTREKPTKLMAVYVVEKGKPLAAPVK